jgi:CRISPR-associated endonuclease/helicase Cas3
MPKDHFHSLYQELTDNPPFRWQERLFALLRHQPPENWPTHVDLPTGLGKTSVIHLWLIALIQQMSIGDVRLPRRLVYVVDRRTVVDQATAIAKEIKEKVDSNHSLLGGAIAVSTLRGQYAGNRDWVIDPSRPAIIIGTVDMIGSRLLFSGYRSSYKLRPLDAGMLGQDTLLVLDEAHLSKPFAKLTRSIEELNRKTPSPIKVIHMSATGAGDGKNEFKLEESDLTGSRDENPIVRRYESEKRLTIHEDVSHSDSKIVEKAAKLAADNSRVVVFVHKPEIADKIAKAIRNYGSKKPKSLCDTVAVLTGTMRGLERDELLRKPENPQSPNYNERRIMQRFLGPANRPAEGPAILVSTSAGEVGFDLNADHLVCDAAPLDSIIQRLGRVNRRGDGKAEVHLFAGGRDEKKKKKEGKDTSPKHTFESASIAAVAALKALPKPPEGADTIYDASPKAFQHLTKPDEALSPKPDTVELTDVLLDAWSMTTIVESMPGRPPVVPWLRGVEKDGPQTTFAWRAELDLDGFDQLDCEDIEEWFDAHRVLPHETLSVSTGSALVWMTERWKALSDEARTVIGERSCIIDRAGIAVMKIKDLINSLERDRSDSIQNADVTLPASFGGIKRGEGLLDPNQPKAAEAKPGADLSKVSDVADERDRCRRVGNSNSEPQPLIEGSHNDCNNFSQFILNLPSNDDSCKQLISLVPKLERREFGTKEQSLSCHVGLVEKYASEIANGLFLDPDTLQALKLAAKWHDCGKDREIWQRAVRKPGEVPKEPIGKSGGLMRPIAGGYRHEFGSLREFNAARDGQIEANVFDLAMHMIAAHHGRGRPHFPKGGFDPCARASSPQIATDAIRRFARLQRHYGHWRLAWLENLLRCADAMASAEKEG